MHGDLLDVFLVLICVSSAYGGYRQGFLVGALSFAGIVGGGLLGTRLAVPVVHALRHHLSAPVVGIAVVFVAASIGQILAAMLGALLRGKLRLAPARVVDSIGGAALSIVSVLLIAWLLAYSIANSSLTGLARQVRRSAVIDAVDASIPAGLRGTLTEFRRVLDTSAFPAVLNPLQSESATKVPAPDPVVLQSVAVQRAKASIVKVTGTAPSCSRRIEGSGFVYAPDRVVTNAHVVAGVRSPSVQVGDRELPATVVLYDSDRDVAVLAVSGLGVTPLRLAGVAGEGNDAVVAGYPQDGPFRAVAARIRQRETITGPNIYQSKQVNREVYAVRADVLPGNSGGPLLSSAGTVFGIVFAASTDIADTGYALTNAEVASDVTAGARATGAVSTGRCD